MRLTLVISSLAIGGAERNTWIVANHWADHGHDVSLLTLDDGAQPPGYPLDARVHHRALDLAKESSNALAGIRNNVRRVVRLRSAIRKSAPDCVVSFIDQTNVLTLLATRGAGVPVVVSECVDPYSHRIGRPWRWLRALLYRRATAVQAPTRVILDRFSRSVRARGIVIPYPVLAAACPAGGDGERTMTRSLVSVGRLTGQKGFDLLLPAFARAGRRHDSWRLTIMGEGPLRRDLESVCERLGLTDRVRFVGKVTDPAVYFHTADLFVAASRYEGFPNALCEAMACGLPVIAMDCPSGPREIIRHGTDGLLVDNGDVEALAEAMSRLMSDDAERARLGARAVEVTERFALPRIMGLWDELLATAVKA